MAILFPTPVVMDFVAFGIMTLAAFGGLGHALWSWKKGPATQMLLRWRRVVAGIGILAVTFQALLFVISWTRIGRDSALFGKWGSWMELTLVVAVPCVLAGKGSARWWLLSSSLLLFIMCFFLFAPTF